MNDHNLTIRDGGRGPPVTFLCVRVGTYLANSKQYTKPATVIVVRIQSEKELRKGMSDNTSNTNSYPTFNSEDEAFDWMYDCVKDEDCVDNFRFAYKDDPAQVEMYEEIYRSGCCGNFDVTVIINGRMAMVGCNYGH